MSVGKITIDECAFCTHNTYPYLDTKPREILLNQEDNINLYREDNMYQIFCDGFYASESTLKKAIEVATSYFLSGHPDEINHTVTIEIPNGVVVASLSPTPITGEFIKQRWYGRNDDYLEDVETVEFDATDTILRMSIDQLRKIEDRRETSDRIGQDHVNWNGPCAVNIESEICRYFGVDTIEEITEENLNFVRDRVKPSPKVHHELTLTVKLPITAQGNVILSEILENLKLQPEVEMTGVTFGTPKIYCENI